MTEHGGTIVTRTVRRPPLICSLRADEHQAGGSRVRAELRQEAEHQEVADRGPPEPGSWARGSGPGGNRSGLGPEIPLADMHVHLQPHGIRELHGLLSGLLKLHNIVLVNVNVTYR